ncbi:hypothetical protein Tco_0976506 [Tanacetum coccineum]|uniref:Uncharacterized protein n=1 Tax=Tanacetum coccineum TaxID=301880 RepID=A0ABQ5EHE2_9ASTR
MSTSTYPIIIQFDSDVEDAFSSTNTPDYTPASPDYTPAAGNTLVFVFTIVLHDMSNDTSYLKALICTQDWVRKSRKPINVDSLEDLLNDDEIVKDMEYELEKGEQNMG